MNLRVSMALLSVFFAVAALGQSAEESAGQAAERAGKYREAFNQYVAALERAKPAPYGAEDRRLREAIVRSARRISPPLPIPEAARNHMIRGRAAFKLAKSPTEAKDAIEEFQQAVKAAPWLGEAYFNLALAQEKAEAFLEAVQNYKVYLATGPSQREAGQIADKIVELQYFRERAQKQQVAKAQQDSSPAGLAGRWCLEAQAEQGYLHRTCNWDVRVNADSVEIFGPFHDPNTNSDRPYRAVYRASIHGQEIRGSFLFSASCSTTTNMSGTIAPGARELRVSYEKPLRVRFPCQILTTTPSWIVLMKAN